MINNKNEIMVINNNYYQYIWGYNGLDGVYLYLINKDDYHDILFVKVLNDSEVEIVKDKEQLAFIINSMTKEINTFVL